MLEEPICYIDVYVNIQMSHDQRHKLNLEHLKTFSSIKNVRKLMKLEGNQLIKYASEVSVFL